MSIQSIQQSALPIFQKYDIRKASLFGSVLRGEDTEKSDIDVLVDMPKKMSLLDVVAFQLDLEDALGKSVDVVEYDLIKPSLQSNILNNQKQIYPV